MFTKFDVQKYFKDKNMKLNTELKKLKGLKPLL